MGILHDVINEGGVTFSGKIGEVEIEALFEAASERCLTEAADRNVYLSDALSNLDRYREPDPAEVREYLTGEDLGNWRKVVTATAYVAVREYLGHQVEKDIDALRTALDEATGRSYVAVAVHSDCPFGWAPHECESGWKTGTFFEWRRLAGNVRVAALSVPVSGGDSLWLQLDRQ